MLPVRDKNGAIRYLDHGNLPLPKEVVRYHKEKIAERESIDGKDSYMMTYSCNRPSILDSPRI